MKTPCHGFFLFVPALLCPALGATAAPGPRITPSSYAYSHHEWLAPAWGEKTGSTLTDTRSGGGAAQVIFKGPAMAIDFMLPGPHKLDSVKVHANRGNQGYRLQGVRVLVRQLGQFTLAAADMRGYDSATPLGHHVFEFADLAAHTDAVRIEILTPSHCSLTEVEFFGRPAAATGQTEGPPLPLTAGDTLIARTDVTAAGGTGKLLLENRFVQLLVDPAAGGIVESVYHKRAGKQLTYRLPGSATFPGGLCEDHNWDPYYSFAQFRYESDLRSTPERAVLVLTGTGRDGIYRFQKIRKTLTFHRDRASLDVQYEFTNEPSSMTDHTSAWWIHNCLAVSGETNTIFLPSERGVQALAWQPQQHGFDTWIYNVSRGWAGVIGESGAGAAVAMDFRTLNCLYACFMPESCTLEWRLTRNVLAPGQSLTAAAQFLFVDGLPNLAGAGAGFAGAVTPTGVVRAGTELAVTGTLFSDRARADVAVSARARRIADGETVPLPTQQAGFEAGQTRNFTWQLSLPPGTYALTLAASAGTDRVLCERQLIVGQADVPYRQEPEAERIGLAGPGGKPIGTLRRHDVSFEIETPHEKWATPLPAGPITAFILVDVAEQRELVELAQRLDVKIDTVKIRTQLSGGPDYRYRGDRSITSLDDAQERILELLTQTRYDVFVIAALDWARHFTPMIRTRIIEQLRGGAGLVWIGPNAETAVDENGLAILPVKGTPTRYWASFGQVHAEAPGAAAGAENLARVIPLAAQERLLAHAHPEHTGTVHAISRLTGGATGTAALIVSGRYHKARTVALLWDNLYSGGRSNTPSRLLPSFPLHDSLRPGHPRFRYWEDLYALLARAIAWAARGSPTVCLLDAEAVTTGPARLRLTTTTPRHGCRLRISWQDAVGAEFASSVHAAPAATPDGAEPAWEIPVPAAAPAGPVYAHIQLRDADDCALDWGVIAFNMPGPVRLQDVEQARPVLPAGAVAEAVAVIGLDPAAVTGLRIDALVQDGYGRELARETLPVPTETPAAHVPLRFATAGALGGQLVAELELRDDTRLYARRSVSYGLTRKQPPRGPRLAAWSMTLDSRQSYLSVLEARRAADLGMDAVLDSYSYVDTPQYRALVESGVAYHPLNCLSIRASDYYAQKAAYAKTGSREHLVRNPCFDDDADRERLLAGFRNHCAAQVKNGGALDYCLGDEMSLSHYSDYSDYCFHPSTLTAFRKWLQQEIYGSLDALNTAWGTAYAAWDKVMPMTYNEAKTAANPAAWGAFRTYMEKSVADFLARVQTETEKMDPGSRISLSGTQSPLPGNGMDWWRMSRAVPLFHSYNTANMCQARRSFSPWQCDEPWFAGYWQEDPTLERLMWWCLFHNCSGVSAWYTPIFFFPDMTYTVSGAQLRAHWRELSGGIWQQVRALRVEEPKVAVHYSQASIHETFLRGPATWVHDAWDGWLRSLEDIGVPYAFVSYEEIEAGRLLETGVRVLILPCSTALSDTEIAAISAFAAAGNTVLADAYPGRTNEHCRSVERAALTRLFGASRRETAGAEALGVRFGDGRELPTLAPDDSLVLQGAVASGQSGVPEAPVMLKHRFGDGTAWLLNFRIAFYSSARRVGKAPEQIWRQLLGKVLEEAGITPSARIAGREEILPHIEILRYLDPEGRPVLYGFLNSLLPGAQPEHFEVSLSGRDSGLVWDVRTGRKQADAPQFSRVFKPGEPTLFAVLEAPVTVARPPQGVGDRGETAELHVAFAGLAFDQALRYTVTDAGGRLRREYSGVVTAPAGAATLRVPLAVNDPPGAWRLRVTHVLTGLEAEGVLTVR